MRSGPEGVRERVRRPKTTMGPSPESGAGLRLRGLGIATGDAEGGHSARSADLLRLMGSPPPM
jgi:hypothetical protein